MNKPTSPAPENAPDAGAFEAIFDEVTSGAFDAAMDGETTPLEDASKRVLAPDAESPKLHKVLAQAGMGSRLEMEQLILEGRITVNNEPAHVGQRVKHGDTIKVNGKPLRIRIAPPPPRVLAYHKPAGEVVTHDDPQNRPTVFRRLPRLQVGKWQSVGRLDLNTEGLLLFTNSGELANRLMHPRFGLVREYAVRVLGALSLEERQRLLDGIQLDDGPAQFQSIEEGGGEGANCWYKVTIAEGRNREVRRMMEAVGHAVSRLIRIRYGAVVLPRGLRRGVWLELDHRDVERLSLASGMERTDKAKEESVKRAQKQSTRRHHGQGPRPSQPKMVDGPNLTPGLTQSRRQRGAGGQGSGQGGRQPDPLQTQLGYIGEGVGRRAKSAGNRSSGPRGGAGGRSGAAPRGQNRGTSRGGKRG